MCVFFAGVSGPPKRRVIFNNCKPIASATFEFLKLHRTHRCRTLTNLIPITYSATSVLSFGFWNPLGSINMRQSRFLLRIRLSSLNFDIGFQPGILRSNCGVVVIECLPHHYAMQKVHFFKTVYTLYCPRFSRRLSELCCKQNTISNFCIVKFKLNCCM